MTLIRSTAKIVAKKAFSVKLSIQWHQTIRQKLSRKPFVCLKYANMIGGGPGGVDSSRIVRCLKALIVADWDHTITWGGGTMSFSTLPFLGKHRVTPNNSNPFCDLGGELTSWCCGNKLICQSPDGFQLRSLSFYQWWPTVRPHWLPTSRNFFGTRKISNSCYVSSTALFTILIFSNNLSSTIT